MRDSVLKIERTPLTREARRPTASSTSVLRGREVHAAHGRRPRRLSARAPDARAFRSDLPHRAHQRGDVRHHRRSKRRVRRDPDGRRVPERGRQHALDGVLLQRGVRRPDDAAAAGPPASATPGDGVHSLTRTTNASNDFALACPTPTNNGPPSGAEVTGTFGPCAPPTSTTTTTVSPTTTSFPTTTTRPTTTTSTSSTTTTAQPSTTTSSISTTSSSTTSTTATTSSTTTTPSTATTTTIAQPTTTTSTTSTTTSSVTSTTLGGANTPPDCDAATASPAELWPPNHQLAAVSVAGVTDPDGDPVIITITGVRQDEPVGATCPDATGVGTAGASLRVERLGGGDGRVYQVSFTADDGRGGQCSGAVTVCVPHDQRPRHACGDQGPLFDSTGPCSSVCGDVCTAIEPALAAPLCPGEQVPAALELRADRARHLLRRAAAARSERKVRTLVARMLKHLRTSAALAGAAEENGRISRACGAALTRRFSEAQGQAVRWSRTR